MDKIQTPNETQYGFLIDNKVQTKNDIISIKNDSISESESCDESSDSDSDTKPILMNKSSKTKMLIKTTKGNSKAPKLSINDSDSDSD
jgi:spore coat protein CotF